MCNKCVFACWDIYCSFMNCENVYTFMIYYVQHIELHRSCRTFLIAPVILAPCLEPQTRFAGTLRLEIHKYTKSNSPNWTWYIVILHDISHINVLVSMILWFLRHGNNIFCGYILLPSRPSKTLGPLSPVGPSAWRCSIAQTPRFQSATDPLRSDGRKFKTSLRRVTMSLNGGLDGVWS